MFCCCPGDKIKEEAKHKPHIKRSYEDPEVDHDSDEENEAPHVLDDNHVENEEGLIVVPEDHIVSEEDYFVESEEESEDESSTDQHAPNDTDEVIVADIDDGIEQAVPAEEGRSMRVNTGAGVERV